MKPNNPAEKVFTYIVGAVGVTFLLLHFPSVQLLKRFWMQALFLAGLVALVEAFPVQASGSRLSTSVGVPLLHACVVLCGREIGMLVAALATFRKKDLSGQTPWNVVLFNRGMLILSNYAFGLTYYGLGGTAGAFAFTRDMAFFALGALADVLVNGYLVSQVIALYEGNSLVSAWRKNLRWTLPSKIAVIPLGILVVVLYQVYGLPSVAMLLLPLALARYSLDRFRLLREVYAELGATLSQAIEHRDGYTHGHSLRVSQYAVLLGKEMGLPDDEVELLHYAGLLHDIGKIGIKDSIMKKDGRYTVEEYEEMKGHAAMGAEMVRGMKFLGKAEKWIRHHHERWDGTGYPQGLKGQDIPLGARIIACADSFDAMTSDRPYKDAITWEAAEKELLDKSGTQFDPEVVKAMLKVIDKLAAQKDKPIKLRGRAW